jgi:hypothetical protein
LEQFRSRVTELASQEQVRINAIEVTGGDSPISIHPQYFEVAAAIPGIREETIFSTNLRSAIGAVRGGDADGVIFHELSHLRSRDPLVRENIVQAIGTLEKSRDLVALHDQLGPEGFEALLRRSANSDAVTLAHYEDPSLMPIETPSDLLALAKKRAGSLSPALEMETRPELFRASPEELANRFSADPSSHTWIADKFMGARNNPVISDEIGLILKTASTKQRLPGKQLPLPPPHPATSQAIEIFRGLGEKTPQWEAFVSSYANAREYANDEFAMRRASNSDAMRSFLFRVKQAEDKYGIESDGMHPPTQNGMHPPTQNRIERLERLAAEERAANLPNVHSSSTATNPLPPQGGGVPESTTQIAGAAEKSETIQAEGLRSGLSSGVAKAVPVFSGALNVFEFGLNKSDGEKKLRGMIGKDGVPSLSSQAISEYGGIVAMSRLEQGMTLGISQDIGFREFIKWGEKYGVPIEAMDKLNPTSRTKDDIEKVSASPRIAQIDGHNDVLALPTPASPDRGRGPEVA